MSAERKICVGMFAGAHGIRGQVRVRSFTAEPEDLFVYEPLTDEKGEKVFTLEVVGVAKDCYVVSVSEAKDRNQAEALKGVKLYVDRSVLPEPQDGAYFDADLVGLEVRADDPRGQGKVLALHDYGAGPFLEVKREGSTSYMLPFTNACVPQVDVRGGFLTAIVPEGWLDSAKPDANEKEETP